MRQALVDQVDSLGAPISLGLVPLISHGQLHFPVGIARHVRNVLGLGLNILSVSQPINLVEYPVDYHTQIFEADAHFLILHDLNWDQVLLSWRIGFLRNWDLVVEL